MTYISKRFWSGDNLDSYVKPPEALSLEPFANQILGLTQNYLDHCFDLLGSGWLKVERSMNCHGFENHRFEAGPKITIDREGHWLRKRINKANLDYARRVWRIVDQEYIPIDWQIDFKSGYRWSERTWTRSVAFDLEGADIKVPWELSRMQHLPQFAWAFILASHGNEHFQSPEVYAREFRNQVLDFIATNPPRYGVNWFYAMDVAIRVVNWLITYDLLTTSGAIFDSTFKKVFIQSIYEHGLHIVNHLEWQKSFASNHYLANIAGLLYVSAYLQTNARINAWLGFAIQELLKEVFNQFYPDGANFEASTSYHRLSAELVLYTTALILGLKQARLAPLQTQGPRWHDRAIKRYQPSRPMVPDGITGARSLFPDGYIERLERMAEFTMHISKPDGTIPQIGDNDNGRFIKLFPKYKKRTVAEAKSLYLNLNNYTDRADNDPFWDEDHLDHRHIVASINALFNRQDFAEFSSENETDYNFLKALAGGVRLPSYRQENPNHSGAESIRIGNEQTRMDLEKKLNSLPENSRSALRIPAPGDDLREDLRIYGYADFGLYLFSSKRLYLAVRCGPIGQNGRGGHGHNDQLSVELTIDGQDLIRDPGSYVYTPLPARRNQYRSVAAHFCPQLQGGEPAAIDKGLFKLDGDPHAKCLYFGEKGFIGTHNGYGKPVFRIIALFKDYLSVMDFTMSQQLLKNKFMITAAHPTIIPYSSGYGARYA